MPHTKTTEEFAKDLYDKYGDEYTVVGKYIGSKIDILIKHNVCNSEFMIRPNSILTGNSRCTICHPPNHRKTQDEFCKDVYNRIGDEYTVIGKYVRNKIPVEFVNNKCGTHFKERPDLFLYNKPDNCLCPTCRFLNRNIRYSFDQVNDKINSLHGNIKLIKYSGCDSVRVECTIHHRVYDSRLSTLLRGKGGCPECAMETYRISHSKTHEDFVKQVAEETNNEYTVVDNYKGTKHRIAIRHNLCGHVSKYPVTHFLNGDTRCYFCSKGAGTSKGNKRVAECLNSIGVKYYTEYPVHINGRLHRYDFYLPKQGLFIEYNGIQHYEPVEYFGGVESFKDRQLRDKEKHEYTYNTCRDILDIKYDQFDNVNEIIEQRLKIYQDEGFDIKYLN